jgi:hypothetical protein
MLDFQIYWKELLAEPLEWADQTKEMITLLAVRAAAAAELLWKLAAPGATAAAHTFDAMMLLECRAQAIL